MKVCRGSLALKICTAAVMWMLIPSCYGQWERPSISMAPQQGTALEISSDHFVQPKELNDLLLDKALAHPLVLQIGSHVLFAEAHIPASEYAGPAGQPDGLTILRKRIKALPRNTFLVLYCGCCPWNHCPNIEPAYKEAIAMGFSNVKVLYLPDNFGANWVAKGYAVEKGR